MTQSVSTTATRMPSVELQLQAKYDPRVSIFTVFKYRFFEPLSTAARSDRIEYIRWIGREILRLWFILANTNRRLLIFHKLMFTHIYELNSTTHITAILHDTRTVFALAASRIFVL